MLGRQAWKTGSGYSRRSFVESTMHRLKSLTGERLHARREDAQRVEVRLRCKVLNGVSVSTARIAV